MEKCTDLKGRIRLTRYAPVKRYPVKVGTLPSLQFHQSPSGQICTVLPTTLVISDTID